MENLGLPRLIDVAGPGETIGLEEFVARLESTRFDPADQDALAAQAPALAALGRNRSFLADVALRELESRCVRQVRENRYSAQVIMLHRARDWFVRACFWPSMEDAIVRASGTAPFFYGVAHDHDFSFLTVGHLGPGYWSEYWERDPDAPPAAPGVPAGLVAKGRRRLEPNQVLLYRASRDVHRQHAADSLSVSLNIMEGSRDRGGRLQYQFDPEHDAVSGILSGTPLTALLPLAVRFGGEAGQALVQEVGARHASGWLRFRAKASLAQALSDRGARREDYARIAREEGGFVADLARDAIRVLDAGSVWMDAAPAPITP